LLYSFKGGNDGASPFASLLADGSGNLYGTTQYGGAGKCTIFLPGCGTVFKLTGTGFVTEAPFSAFSSKLVISGHGDYFELLSNVTLGSGTAYLNPASETVTLQVGTYSATIPPGSFAKGSTFGEWDFDGTVNSVAIHAKIWLTGTKHYEVLVKAMTKLTGAANPVPVTLTLGPNTGSAAVTAAIYP
jgi:hypothetical protein